MQNLQVPVNNKSNQNNMHESETNNNSNEANVGCRNTLSFEDKTYMRVDRSAPLPLNKTTTSRGKHKLAKLDSKQCKKPAARDTTHEMKGESMNYMCL
jgi:hypothetical protein